MTYTIIQGAIVSTVALYVAVALFCLCCLLGDKWARVQRRKARSERQQALGLTPKG